MTHVIQALQRVNNQLPELLSEEFVGGLARAVGWQWRKRVLSPVVMVHLLIVQILHCNTAYTHLPRASKLSFTAAAFCQAKGRLPLALLARLIESVWLRCSKADDSTLFHGHRTFYTDGSAASMPDTRRLQDRYGMPSGMKEGCGFPVVKLLMLFDAAKESVNPIAPLCFVVKQFTATCNLSPVPFGSDPTGPLQQETVTAVQVHTVYSLRDVTLKNADGTTETIDTTDSHRFYVQGQGRVSADDLMAGETLSTPDGQTETVVGTSSVAEPQGVLVYNFTVADDHTYFMEGFGNNGTTGSTPGSLLDAVWVHNECEGFAHLFPRRLGSSIPYRNKVLTYLSAVDHTAFHADLNAYLSRYQIESAKYGLVNLGRSNLSRDIAMELWSGAERVSFVRNFMTTWRGGQYLQNFEGEIQWLLQHGGIH